ncbi:MAG TPA: HAMP domain-containing sensor histidine kinase [Candidatus Limnocylindrales bacterium]
MWGPRGRRPPWWPDSEPWPPDRGAWRRVAWANRRRGGPYGPMGPWNPRTRRHGFARWIGCFVLFLALVVGSIGILLVWLLGTLLGLVTSAAGSDGLVRSAVLVLVVFVVVGILAAIRFSQRISTPLTDLVDAAGRVEAGDYGVRVSERHRGPMELRGLTRAFNTMTARLEADEAQRRTLLAEISHELRNPIAIVQGNIEALIDGVYPADQAHLEPILEETKVLSRLVEDLRTLSLAEAGTLTLHPEPTDVDVLAGDVVESFQAAGSKAGVTVAADVPDDLPILEVDPIRIREVLSNLVDNALRYTPSGGSIAVAGRHAGDRVVLTVTDTGPGIAAELLPTVFDRFAKSADSHGSGLGLAIARAIVEAHEGTIAAESPVADGHGTTIRISLPAT